MDLLVGKCKLLVFLHKLKIKLCLPLTNKINHRKAIQEVQPITYQQENKLSVFEFKELLIASTLGERRPIADLDRLETMLRAANLMLTARAEGRLVGLARSLTDKTFCTYLSDLAVNQDYQNQGIGKALIQQTKAAYPLAKLILLSAPKAIGYYPKIGMRRHEHCFFLDGSADAT